MARLIILGTSNAVATASHESTHLLLEGEKSFILIDCAGNPVVHLQKGGLDATRLTALVLTHFHPDHVSGVPLLLMTLWLLGRKTPLDVYGLADTLDRMEGVLELYQWGEWPGFFPVNFHRLPGEPHAAVLEDEDFRLTASPVRHLIPTIGLRCDFLKAGKSVAYSGDTEPCPAVEQLAAGAHALIHEATGAYPGHSSPAQAAQVAHSAGVEALYLVHYNAVNYQPAALQAEAAQIFPGPVTVAQDFMEITF